MTDNVPRNDAASRTSNRSRRRTDCMSLPFSTHPLYQLRRILVIVAVLGALLCVFATSFSPYYYSYGAIVHTCIFLCLSAFLCLLDLICWGTRKKDHPDEDPDRPTGRWALVDLIAAIALQFAFWGSIPGLSYPYSYDEFNLLGAYGILGALVCSILHAVCFWRQLMDSKKKAWLSTLTRPVCARCGYVEEQNDPPASGEQGHEEQPNIFPYAGPSAEFGRSNVMTPESPERAMEEGLLIGSDFGSNYGSVERDEPVLEPPEGVVVGKGKKKAKSSGSQKSSTKASSS